MVTSAPRQRWWRFVDRGGVVQDQMMQDCFLSLLEARHGCAAPLGLVSRGCGPVVVFVLPRNAPSRLVPLTGRNKHSGHFL